MSGMMLLGNSLALACILMGVCALFGCSCRCGQHHNQLSTRHHVFAPVCSRTLLQHEVLAASPVVTHTSVVASQSCSIELLPMRQSIAARCLCKMHKVGGSHMQICHSTLRLTS